MKTSLVSTAALTRAIDSSKEAALYQNQLANDLQKLLETGMDTLSNLRSFHSELYMSATNLEMTINEVVDSPKTVEIPTDSAAIEVINEHLSHENIRLARAVADLYTLIQVKLHSTDLHVGELQDHISTVSNVDIDVDSIEGSFYRGSIQIDSCDFDTDMTDLSKDMKNELKHITDKHSEMKRLATAIYDNAIGNMSIETDNGNAPIDKYIAENVEPLEKVFNELEATIVGDTIPDGYTPGILHTIHENQI